MRTHSFALDDLLFGIVLHGLLDDVQAIAAHKINSLSYVVTMREPAVIRLHSNYPYLCESKHIVPRSLMHLEDVNPCLDELQRIDHQCDLFQKILLAIVLVIFLDILIEHFFLMAWDDIPCFCLTIMRVINRVEEEVLDMPAKCSKLHAHIHPRQ